MIRQDFRHSFYFLDVTLFCQSIFCYQRRQLIKNIKAKSLALHMSLSGRNVLRKHIMLPPKKPVRVQNVASLIIIPIIRIWYSSP